MADFSAYITARERSDFRTLKLSRDVMWLSNSMMASSTSFLNKISDLEARLKAETERRRPDQLSTEFVLDSPRRPRPCMYLLHRCHSYLGAFSSYAREILPDSFDSYLLLFVMPTFWILSDKNVWYHLFITHLNSTLWPTFNVTSNLYWQHYLNHVKPQTKCDR